MKLGLPLKLAGIKEDSSGPPGLARRDAAGAAQDEESTPRGAEAAPGAAAPNHGADTPDPPPIVDWIEDLVDDAALPQPGAGPDTRVRQRPCGIDCERLSRMLSQLPAASSGGAELRAPLAEPATIDCARLSCEMREQQGPMPEMTVSIGTVGHPSSCSDPCEDVGLPGGCPRGSMCKKCHLCGVSGAGQAKAAPPGLAAPGIDDSTVGKAWLLCPSVLEPSVGSRGHPTCCAEPCKYRKRRGGCRNGAACSECHLCHWRRQPLEEQQPAAARAASPAAERVDGPRPDRLAEQASPVEEPPSASELPGSLFWSAPPELGAGAPSLGSIGHPLCCGPPCKYFHKKVGCKDGRSCVRCHLCQWHRYQARVPPGPPARCYQLGPRQLPGAPDCGPCAEGHTYSF